MPIQSRIPYRARAAGALFLLASALPSGLAGAQSQASGLAAVFQSGQTFLTWSEVAGGAVSYRVYRRAAPITSSASLAAATLLGEVGQDSSENVRETQLLGNPSFLKISDLGPALASSMGLFVHTASAPEPAWYAVTAVIGAVENTTVVVGSNALAAPIGESPAAPRPVLQAIQGLNRHYVHWVSDLDTPFAPAMWIAPSRAFNLRISYDSNVGTGPRPVLLALHARNGNYKNATIDAAHPETIVVSPDDWIGAAPTNTFWYGLNAAFPDTAAYAGSPNVDYTVRRVMAELDFALASFPTDPERVYARGSSMGGIGSVFLAYRYPERFAAVHATVPKFDFGCSASLCWIEPATGDLLWGSVAQDLPTSDGIGVYERLDIGYLASASPLDLSQPDPGADRPLITTFNGRNDVVVGWPEKPPTYAAILAARQPAAFFWDESTHSTFATGPWSAVITERRHELWDFRIHQALPAFAGLALDGDPGDGSPSSGDPVGTIDGYLDWEPETIVDQPTEHSIEVGLRSGPGLDAAPAASASVDWTPRRLQSFASTPFAYLRFRNTELAGGTLTEDRLVQVDAAGLATVPAAEITQAGNGYRLSKVDLAALPVLLATGVPELGGELALHVFASAGTPALLFAGFLPASIAIPGISGTILIADPFFLAALPIGAGGKGEHAQPLDPSLAALVGVPIRLQALAGLALTNLEQIVLQF